MKFLLTVAAIWLGGICCASAQSVSVDVILDQEHYLPHEPLIAKVRITNFSGQPLKFGTDDEWLSFSIEGPKGLIVTRLSPVPVKAEFSLESSQVATKSVDLAPCFDLSRSGRYRIAAAVTIPQWKRSVESSRKVFDIVSGSKLWDQEFGVPGSAEANNGVPEIRKYALVQANHLKQLRLYLRLSNASESEIFRVFPIGPMVSFSIPEAQVDRFNNVHILHQVGARSFNYVVVNPDGVLISRETHDYAPSRPVLRTDRDGRIGIGGGSRRYASTDLPPASSSTSISDAAAPQP
jgi:hypothetical protein